MSSYKDPCDNRYYYKNGYPNHIKNRISELPDTFLYNTIQHSNYRIKKSKYLKPEDRNNKDVKIEIPNEISVHSKNNLIFEVGTEYYENTSYEVLKRVCIRLRNKPVKVTNTNNSYENYEYCLVFEIDGSDPGLKQVKLVTVYLNSRTDMHEHTLDSTPYVNM